jgi:putative flippase GtrA
MEPCSLSHAVPVGRGLDAAVETALEIGPASRALEGHPPELRLAATNSIDSRNTCANSPMRRLGSCVKRSPKTGRDSAIRSPTTFASYRSGIFGSRRERAMHCNPPSLRLNAPVLIRVSGSTKVSEVPPNDMLNHINSSEGEQAELMGQGAGAVSADRRSGSIRFLRFCAVGGAGLIFEASVLFLLVHKFAFNPIVARALSFSIAVVLTFDLNRRWSFRIVRHRRMVAAFGAYLAVQGVGFLCNFAIYGFALLSLPAPLSAPLICLALASILALPVNFMGAERLVFSIGAPGSGSAAIDAGRC